MKAASTTAPAVSRKLAATDQFPKFKVVPKTGFVQPGWKVSSDGVGGSYVEWCGIYNLVEILNRLDELAAYLGTWYTVSFGSGRRYLSIYEKEAV